MLRRPGRGTTACCGLLAMEGPMALGKRKRERHLEAFVAASDLPQSAGYPFDTALNRLLAENDFDSFVEALCAPYEAGSVGRPSISSSRRPFTAAPPLTPRPWSTRRSMLRSRLRSNPCRGTPCSGRRVATLGILDDVGACDGPWSNGDDGPSSPPTPASSAFPSGCTRVVVRHSPAAGRRAGPRR
jgi:hypothetical protein